MFRDKVELKNFEKMDPEYRELLGRLLTIQADCEIGGPHLYVEQMLPGAPTKLDQLIVARTAAEEIDHYRKIARLAGEIGVDVSFVLSWPNQKRYLETFRGKITTWEDFAVFGFLIDRVGHYQLEEFIGCTFAPIEPLLPDIITLDILMPGMDGWAVLRALKTDPRTSEIPVIMISMVDDKEMGHALGAAEYLVKPIDRDRLAALVRKHSCEAPPCSVLIVEDDPAAREVMRRTLEQEKWKVCEAENGRVALDTVAKRGPDLIILDLMMPEMDGFEFVAELRRNEEWRDIPVIVVTAKDLSSEDRTRLAGRVKRIFQKSAMSREQLAAEIRSMLSQSSRRGGAPLPR